MTNMTSLTVWWLYLKIPVPHLPWITESTETFIISSLEIRLRRKRYFWWSWFWLYSEIISRKALGMMPSCVFCHPSIKVIMIWRWLDEKYLTIGLELWSRLESSSPNSCRMFSSTPPCLRVVALSHLPLYESTDTASIHGEDKVLVYYNDNLALGTSFQTEIHGRHCGLT